jgi:UDPglucose 6-dehydrogenase
MIKKITSAFNGDVSSKKIAVLGLTFKPDTDDMRDSPALAILPVLLEKGAKIVAYDPKGMEEAKELLPEGITYVDDPCHAINEADAVVILTEWNAFRGMDLEKIKQSMKDNKFIDLRNIYEPADMKKKGFDYHCIGRNS